jgi:peptide/nickel transport system ATP-binding protein/oligopeptide transport system ATP-binding protein
MSPPETLLEVRDLAVAFTTEDGVVRAVDGLDLDLGVGEILAVVGESGSGKSATAMTLMGLTRGPNASISGTAGFEGSELIGAGDEELRNIRGNRISMIFQDPMSSLDPVYRVADQIVEQIQAHREVPAQEARRRAIELLDSVGIPDAAVRADAYPHELSGGMRQRAMIAMALSLEPSLLIADEPTTALDVTIQAQIIDLLRDLNRERGLSILLITHDIGVVTAIADRVAVMYAGRIVEQGTLDEVFYDPQHPYTWGLLGSLTRIDRPRPTRLPHIPGTPPSLLSPPTGCHFRPRCPHAFDRCTEVPDLTARLLASAGHLDRCWLSSEAKRDKREVDGTIALGSTSSSRSQEEQGEVLR